VREIALPFGFDERGPFRKVDSTGNAKGGRFVESLIYPVTNPFTGEEVFPRKGRCWVYKKGDMLRMVEERRFFWGKDGKAGTPMRKLFITEAKAGMSAPTVWDDVGLNQHAAREIELLFGEKAAFETPKPENLMKRILEIATNPGDLVLDSFLGSGTTAAVAHKMGRRYIGIEMGEHARPIAFLVWRRSLRASRAGLASRLVGRAVAGFAFTRWANRYSMPMAAFIPLCALRHWPLISGTSRLANPARQHLIRRCWACIRARPMYLLYNGILGDRRPAGGNVLTSNVLAHLDTLFSHGGPCVIYGETTRLGEARLREAGITFKQIPYDIKAR
jgi:adenine-specific DNA-methyltransferase